MNSTLATFGAILLTVIVICFSHFARSQSKGWIRDGYIPARTKTFNPSYQNTIVSPHFAYNYYYVATITFVMGWCSAIALILAGCVWIVASVARLFSA